MLPLKNGSKNPKPWLTEHTTPLQLPSAELQAQPKRLRRQETSANKIRLMIDEDAIEVFLNIMRHIGQPHVMV